MLCRDVLVLETAHLLERGHQHRAERVPHGGFGDTDLLGAILETRMQPRRHRLGRHLEAAQQRRHEPVLLLEERKQQMLWLHSGVLQLLRRLLRGGQRLLRALGEPIQSHEVVIPPRGGG